MSSSKNFVTGVVIFSYFKLWTATPFEAGDEPKFTVSLLIDKTDAQTLKTIKENYDQVLNADFEGTLPYGAKPGYLIDGAVRYPNDPFYEGKWILNCNQNADRPPQVLDENRQPIMDKSQAHSGCIGHALISFYGYQGGSKGIGCSIHGVMITGKGVDLGGGSVDAAAGFADAGIGGDAPVQPPAQQPAQQQPVPPPNNAPTPPPAKPAPNLKQEYIDQGYTYQSFIDSGWTHEQLVESGYCDA